MATAVQPGLPLVNAEAAPAPARGATKPRTALIVLPLLSALALAGGGAAYFAGLGKQTTDDAQIEGHVAYVAPHIAGQVKRVLVKDNERVREGQLLVELDDRDASMRVASARADVSAATAALKASETELALTRKSVESNLVVARGGLTQAASIKDTSQAAIAQARADLQSDEARRTLAQTEFTRTAQLFESGALSQANYDQDRSALDQAEATVQAARARLFSAQAGIQSSAGSIQSARGRVLLAEAGPEQIQSAEAAVELAHAKLSQVRAALEQAELNLSYTQVKAEVSGVVSRRSVEIGQMAGPERPLLALVPLEDTWVVANFKEDQIRGMKPGQSALVRVDAYSDQRLTGRVESLAGGTGARFALLPADNASGNFTKVVQRVPVLIRLDPHPALELRPGLSAEATVVTD